MTDPTPAEPAPAHPAPPRAQPASPWARRLWSTAPALAMGLVLALVVGLGTHVGTLGNMGYLRELLVLSLAGLTVAGWSRACRTKGRRAALVLALMGVAGAGFWAQSHKHAKELGNEDQLYVWGLYHYYLGAKYFDELGYTHLYEQSLVADAEGAGRLNAVQTVRDLETYRFVGAEQVRQGVRLDTWTDERWEEFKADLAFITKLRGRGYWQGPLRDRGYNPSPAWHAVGGSVAKLLSIRSPAPQTVVVLLDVLLVLAAFAVSVWAFGWARSALVLAAFYLWFGNPDRMFGQMFVQDWFAATWAGVALWRRGKARLSGALLGYAAMVRVFPVLLLAGPVVHCAATLVKERRLPREQRRLLAAAGAAMLLLFLVGGFSSNQGFGMWASFAGNIGHHSQEHAFGSKRLGLQHLFGLDWSGGLSRPAAKIDNRRNMRRNAVLLRATQVLLAALVVVALLRSDRRDALLLGATLVFVGTVASRYYRAIFVLLLLMASPARGDPLPATAGKGVVARPRPGAWRGLDGALLFIAWAVYACPVHGAEGWKTYVWANTLLLAWFLILLAVAIRSGRWLWNRRGERA